MKQNRLLPYFGANTANAARVGELLTGCSWVGIPFAGGMSEVPHIKASTIVVNDKHDHVINLCFVLADPVLKEQLVEKLDLTPFHPVALTRAQEDAAGYDAESFGMGDVYCARAYFISQWMGRSGNAGTDREFESNLPIRTNSNGGDSCKRFRSAVESLDEWAAVMRRCNFSCGDWKDWAAKFHGDTEQHGYYLDPPWVKEGDAYIYNFSTQDHRDVASWARGFQAARVVVRYGDCELIRKLYAGWTFHEMPSRNQGNNEVREVLITNR